MTDFTIRAAKTTPPTPNELRDLINQFNGLMKQFKVLQAEHEELKAKVARIDNRTILSEVDGPINFEEPETFAPIEFDPTMFDAVMADIRAELAGEKPMIMAPDATTATLLTHVELTGEEPVVDLGGFKDATAEVEFVEEPAVEAEVAPAVVEEKKTFDKHSRRNRRK